MKTIAAAFPAHKDVRRVSKPRMEKRRRDRINQSLETLRLMLLENRPTCNEKLRNPKVEKAEILESVVHFLKTEMEVEKPHYSDRVLSKDYQGGLRSPCKNYQKYGEGMRSCLLRVGHFLATKSQELGETTRNDDDAASSLDPQMGFSSVQTPHATPEQLHRALKTTSVCYPSIISGQHLPAHHYPIRQVSHPHMVHALSESTQRTGPSHDHDTRKLLSPNPTMDLSDPVWRPWPQ